jgi:hypothetical protein
VDGLTELGSGIYRITDPRPMEGIALLIQRKFGVSVSYEEEVLQYSGDMVYAAELPGNQAAAAKAPGWKGPLVPRLGTVEVTLPPENQTHQIADPTPYIEDAIRSHVSNKNSGRFKIINLGEYGYSIAMNQLADSSGNIVEVVPALDTRISFPRMSRSLGETLTIISKSIAAAGRQGFGFGPPGGSGRRYDDIHVEIGADNEPARNVLARTLRIPGQQKRAWHLSAMPSMGQDLSEVVTGVEVIDSKGRLMQQIVYWPR